MKLRTTLFASAAAALSLSLAGAAGAAEIVNIGSANNNQAVNAFVWTEGAAPGTGTLSVADRLVAFNFNDDLVNDGFGQNAWLTFTAVADGDPLQEEGDGTFRQTGMDGTFEFRTAAGGGGSLLLGGVFSGSWLTGKNQAGGFMSVLDGGTLQLTSGVTDLSAIFNDSAEFGFSGVIPGFGDLDNDNALDSFAATGFSATFSGAVVPEPSTWALMIIGFGGAGAMMRRRRRALAAA